MGESSNSVMTSLKYSVKNYINFIFASYGFLLVFVLYGFWGLWLISYLMLKYKYDRSTATLVCSSFYVSSAISGAFWGYLSTKCHRRKVFLILTAVLMCVCLVTLYVNASTSMIVIIGSSIMSGIGFGAFDPVFWATVRENNAYYNCTEIAIGMVLSMVNASGFVSQFLIGILMDMHWQHVNGGNGDHDGDRIYSVGDYDFAFLTFPICLGLAIIFTVFMKETYAKTVDYSVSGL